MAKKKPLVGSAGEKVTAKGTKRQYQSTQLLKGAVTALVQCVHDWSSWGGEDGPLGLLQWCSHGAEAVSVCVKQEGRACKHQPHSWQLVLLVLCWFCDDAWLMCAGASWGGRCIVGGAGSAQVTCVWTTWGGAHPFGCVMEPWCEKSFRVISRWTLKPVKSPTWRKRCLLHLSESGISKIRVFVSETDPRN